MKILSIDVGGTNIKYGIIDSGNLQEFHEIPTPKNKKDFLKALGAIINAAEKVSGIGIDLPGILDFKSGKIVRLPNLPFLNGFEIKKFLKKFNKNVRIGNDAKSILLAEHFLGYKGKFKNALLVAIGTGIGGAVLIDGKVYLGNGAAGEFGHMVLDNDKSFETLAAGKTVKNHSKEEYKRVSKNLGVALANLINAFDPEAVIFSGGLANNHLKEFLPSALKEMQKFLVNPSAAKRIKFLPAKLGERAGVLGTGLLFS